MAYRHILFATDFSSGSDRAGVKAMEMARQCGARLTMVHVVESMGVVYAAAYTDGVVLPEDLTLEQRLEDRARQEMDKQAERLGGVDMDQVVAVGSVTREIKRLATSMDVDLIMLGSHGRHGLELLLGSTANAVLHGAPCDVLAVRVHDQEE